MTAIEWFCKFLYLSRKSVRNQLFSDVMNRLITGILLTLSLPAFVTGQVLEPLSDETIQSAGQNWFFGDTTERSVIAPASPTAGPITYAQLPQEFEQTEFPCDVCLPPIAEPEKSSDEKKFPTASLTGFFHLDTAWFSQDETNRLTLGDIEDGLGFRRARLAARGEVAGHENGKDAGQLRK